MASKKGRKDRPGDLARRRAWRGEQEPASWVQANAETLLRAVHAVAESGGMLGFGKTRDGGALTVCVWTNGELEREYFRPSDDINYWLESVVKAMENPPGSAPLGDTPRTSPETPGATKQPFKDRETWEREVTARLDKADAERKQLSLPGVDEGDLTHAGM